MNSKLDTLCESNKRLYLESRPDVDRIAIRQCDDIDGCQFYGKSLYRVFPTRVAMLEAVARGMRGNYMGMKRRLWYPLAYKAEDREALLAEMFLSGIKLGRIYR